MCQAATRIECATAVVAFLFLDRGGELGDRLVQVIDVGEDPSDNDRVLGIEASLQRFA